MSRTYHFIFVVYRMKVAGNQLHRLQSMTTALVGVFFFNAIIGVFGLRLAIAGLAAFVLGAVVVCVAFPAQGAES